MLFLEKNEYTPEHDKPIGNSTERIIIGGENESRIPSQNNRVSNELLQKFEGKTREVGKYKIIQLALFIQCPIKVRSMLGHRLRGSNLY